MYKKIGKSRDADLVIPADYKKVSRNHLSVKKGNDGAVYIMDMKSMNGSSLNGQTLAPEKYYKVNAGDEILLGNQYKLSLTDLEPLFANARASSSESISASPSSESEAEYEFQYAGFWVRWGAYIIDSLILSIPLTLLYLLFVYMGLSSRNFQLIIALWILDSILSIVITWLYFASSESGVNQATLGKRLFQLTVVDVELNQITFGRATGRHFAKILSIIVLIGFVMAGFHPEKRAFHDVVSGTRVLRYARKLRYIP